MSGNLSTIVSEKHEKDNFQARKFRLTNFLMEKELWSFINGDEQEPVLGTSPTIADLKTFKEWHEKAKKIMYWLSLNDCAYTRCRNAKGGMGYIGEVV